MDTIINSPGQSTPPNQRLNLPQRIGRFFDQAIPHGVKLLRNLLTGIWTLIGSRQTFNFLAFLVVIMLIYIAQQVALARQHLGVIAEAQQVVGYATMRQMRAMGWTPDGPANTQTKPAGRADPPRSIDPALLSGVVSASASTTSTSTAPAVK